PPPRTTRRPSPPGHRHGSRSGARCRNGSRSPRARPGRCSRTGWRRTRRSGGRFRPPPAPAPDPAAPPPPSRRDPLRQPRAPPPGSGSSRLPGMNDGLAYTVIGTGLVVAAFSGLMALLGRPPRLAHLVGLGLVELAMVVYAVLAMGRMFTGERPDAMATFVGYLLTAV